jgi:hypothetical protein
VISLSNKVYRLFIILLTLAVFYNSAGFVILFLHADENNRSEMLERISTHNYLCDLDILRIEKNKLNQLIRKNENEFEYNGNMYDLIKTKSEGDFLIIYCLNDIKEKSLNNMFLNLIDEFHNKHHPNNQRNINHADISPAIIKFRYIIKGSTSF